MKKQILALIFCSLISAHSPLEKKTVYTTPKASTILYDQATHQKKEALSPPKQEDQKIHEKNQKSSYPENEVPKLSSQSVKQSQFIVDFYQIYAGSPVIYTILLFLSTVSIALSVYAFLKLRTGKILPRATLSEIRETLIHQSSQQALALCHEHPSIVFQMIATGIQSGEKNPQALQDIMKEQGKRASHFLWQRIGLLNDIAMLAPMLGLLGTVLGMFYAFYDLNRSIDSLSTLFDGLGISVGTTIGGLIVSILALVFYTLTKYQLVRQLTAIEAEAETFTSLIGSRESI